MKNGDRVLWRGIEGVVEDWNRHSGNAFVRLDGTLSATAIRRDSLTLVAPPKPKREMFSETHEMVFIRAGYANTGSLGQIFDAFERHLDVKYERDREAAGAIDEVMRLCASRPGSEMDHDERDREAQEANDDKRCPAWCSDHDHDPAFITKPRDREA